MASLHLVPLQLYLPGMERSFPGPSAGPGEFDRYRDQRDAYAWITSAIDYCHWRSGLALRPGRDAQERAARRDYQDAIRLLSDILCSAEKPTRILPVLPPINQEPGYSAEALALMKKPVSYLVDQLMLADSRLTMRASLIHLNRGKLARMLVAARAHARQDRRTA